MSATHFKWHASAPAPLSLLKIATLQLNPPPDVLHAVFKIMGIDVFIKGYATTARGDFFLSQPSDSGQFKW